jgi:hydrogenase expression/formation protein HypE
MNDLIEKMMLKAFSNPELDRRHDGAILDLSAGKLAYTTDSHVVTPLFYPGGDIGSLSVFGTVNDLAMCGATAGVLSAGLIIEEGFSMETLWRVVTSMADAADTCGVRIVTGDTKVVDRGKGDGIYINTSGIGVIPAGVSIGPWAVEEGDAIIVSGDIGRHGMAIMTAREGIEIQGGIQSDLAPLNGMVSDLMETGMEIHCMRDLTRGGLASGLVEIVSSSGFSMEIEENAIPVSPQVMGACEILGFDPLYVANEGRFVLFIPASDTGRALEILGRHDSGTSARVIGKVTSPGYEVVMISSIGARRIVDMISGEQLPRIC